jgi:hypothetical protein
MFLSINLYESADIGPPAMTIVNLGSTGFCTKNNAFPDF